jgi:hypothetical protein
MGSFDCYFVDEVTEPVKIVQIGQDTPTSHATRSFQQTEVSKVDDLTEYLETSRKDYTCRLMLVAFTLVNISGC